ncbi:MAG: hypothetical protein DME79_02035 [Verrucomicrobia bacterium]|nr:MAG: hypothetical protein DME79_02035 [Verrucomicrobiota bacterium]
MTSDTTARTLREISGFQVPSFSSSFSATASTATILRHVLSRCKARFRQRWLILFSLDTPADLGLTAKTRPVVILSRHDPDAPRALAVYVPLTTQNRGSKYEVRMPQLAFLREPSVANVQGIASVPVTRLERKIGELPADVLKQIRESVNFALDLA